MQITTVDGERKWVGFKFQKKRFGGESGYDVLICTASPITNINVPDYDWNLLRQYQYLEEIASFSNESLFFIDVKTKTLRQRGAVALELGIHSDKENFPESIYKLVHPDSLDSFKQYVEASFTGVSSYLEMQVKTKSGDYQWYKIKSKAFFNESSEVTEVFGLMTNIQKEKESNQRHSEETSYFKAMQGLSDDIIYRVDTKTMTLHHSMESPHPLLKNKVIPNYVDEMIRYGLVHPDDVQAYLDGLKSFYAGGSPSTAVRFALLSSEYIWYKIKGERVFDKDGELVEVWGRLISIQKEQRIQKELSVLSQYFLAMQDLTHHILFHIDLDTMVLSHADKNAISLDIPTEIPNFIETLIELEVIQSKDADLFRLFSQKLLSGENMEYQIQVAVDVGVYEWFHVKSRFIHDEYGTPVEVFGGIVNIQKQKDLELRASQDLMTKVLNKISFEEAAIKIFIDSTEDDKHALIFIDLDDFKGINDRLGHAFGDFLLISVGERLNSLTRKDDVVGRIGGDEFMVLLRGIDCEKSALVRAKILLKSLQDEFVHEDKSSTIKASLGVSVYPKDGTSFPVLRERADLAMYVSKNKGKNIVSMYHETMKDL